MSHRPTPADVAADLMRCIYASYSQNGFDDENVVRFLTHAKNSLYKIKDRMPKTSLRIIEQRLKSSMNKQLSIEKRREDFLTASIFLKS